VRDQDFQLVEAAAASEEAQGALRRGFALKDQLGFRRTALGSMWPLLPNATIQYAARSLFAGATPLLEVESHTAHPSPVTNVFWVFARERVTGESFL